MRFWRMTQFQRPEGALGRGGIALSQIQIGQSKLGFDVVLCGNHRLSHSSTVFVLNKRGFQHDESCTALIHLNVSRF